MVGDKRTKIEIVGDIYDHVIEKSQKANKRCRLVKSDVASVVDEFLGAVSASLAEGKTIELRGFGTFQVKRRAAKSNSRNPRSGEPVETTEHYVPIFRPGIELKAAVRRLGKEGQDVSEE